MVKLFINESRYIYERKSFRKWTKENKERQYTERGTERPCEEMSRTERTIWNIKLIAPRGEQISSDKCRLIGEGIIPVS